MLWVSRGQSALLTLAPFSNASGPSVRAVVKCLPVTPIVTPMNGQGCQYGRRLPRAVYGGEDGTHPES